MNVTKIFSNQYFWLSLIILIGFILRLYKIDSPIADWHSWRQADTAAVTRNFVKMGFNPFYPKYDDMSAVSENPKINPGRFRFVEFPIYNIFVYPFYYFFGINDIYHRLVSTVFSLGSIVFLFLIAKKYLSIFTSLVAAFIYAVLPFNVFFSRSTLPEPTFIFFSLGMLYLLSEWIDCRKSRFAFWGLIFTAIAFLIKPWAIFFFLPTLYLLLLKRDIRFFLKFVLQVSLAILPFILWRLWMQQFPEGIPASSWLINGDGIRFRPAFWWWIVSERMGREIMGATGLALFVLGLILKPIKGYFLHIWLLSSILFIVIFATGNVRHNYYQTQLIPIISVFMAIGFTSLLKGYNFLLPRIWTIIIAIFLLVLSFYFTFKIVNEFYNVNNPDMVEAGKMADMILPKSAVVLAPYNGDTAFLYQTNRPGFAMEILPIPQLVAEYGVTHYVSTSYDDKTNWVKKHFEEVYSNDKYFIGDLTKVITPLDK